MESPDIDMIDWLSIAVNVFNMQPSEFWNMRPFEFIAVMDGKRKMNSDSEKITRADLVYSERALRVKGII